MMRRACPIVEILILRRQESHMCGDPAAVSYQWAYSAPAENAALERITFKLTSIT
jgi:hypothetical protein